MKNFSIIYIGKILISSGINLLKSLFETNDTFDEVVKTLEFGSGYKVEDMHVHTPPAQINAEEIFTYTGRNMNPQRAVALSTNDFAFHIYADTLMDVEGKTIEVRYK